MIINKKIKNIGGQSLIEIMIAMAIIVIGISGVISLIYSQQFLAVDKEGAATAETIAAEGVAAAKWIARNDWNSLTTGEHGLLWQNNSWQLNGVSDQMGIFTRKLTVSDVDAYTKKTAVKVEWPGTANRTLSVNSVALITTWSDILNKGGGLGSDDTGLSGDWTNPRTLGQADIGAGREGTDVEVKNSIVYLSSVASAADKKDLSIFNVTNPQSPVLLGELDTGGGINSISLGGNYLYAVSSDNAQEFLIINVTNPALPIKISGLDLIGSSDAISVFYHNGYAYVGRKEGAAQELVVINVANPLLPQVVGGLSGVGGEINDIFANDNVAYIGTEDSGRGMLAINIATPASPAILGSINFGGHGYGVYSQNAARTFVGGSNNFYAVDASTPGSMISRGSVSTGGKVNDVVAVGNYAFLATSNSTKEFEAINIADPSALAIISSFNFPQIATGIAYENNLVFISVRSNDALRIITSSP